MDFIYYTLKVLMLLFIFIVIIKICVGIANYIGEQLGFGKFFIYLWGKIRKK